MKKNTEKKGETQKKARPPIVVVVGHIDHGKTTILDWYRKSRVTAGESGGITQHMGAYEVVAGTRRFTFIDTPGHEAFPRLRVRGAKIADIGILVVAADEGVKPQTREAIAVLRKAEIPFVVAFNKSDKPDANPERVKQELAQEEVLVESYGGQVPSVSVSAKTGEHMDDLLETLGLLAELEELECDPALPAEGMVLETEMAPPRGVSATLLVRDGTLHKGDIVVIGRHEEAVKILEDSSGRAVASAGPSSPVSIAGLGRAPAVGDVFRAFASHDAAAEFIRTIPADEDASPNGTVFGEKTKGEGGRAVFTIIVKADVFGSLEALRDALANLSGEQVAVRILWSDIGDINETDIKRAAATHMVTIVGFRVRATAGARELARTQKIRIVSGDVIYDLIDRVKETIIELIPAEVKRIDLGKIKVLKIFRKENGKQVVGGRVTEGKAVKGARFDLVRMRDIAGGGTIAGLQREHAPAEEVVQGFECGIMTEGRGQIEEGDELVMWQEETKKIVF
ncbi:MAG: translation initiation factor IF-2 [Candidatus Sungbacteria bacterium]|nr:translation initiation factor IF-2 [Candidatus Sungbacteria bacterium]